MTRDWTASTGWLPRLFRVPLGAIALEPDQTVVAEASGEHRVAYGMLQTIGLRRQGLWWQITLTPVATAPLTIRGLTGRAARRVVAAVQDLRLRPQILALLRDFDKPEGRDGYLTRAAHAVWAARASTLSAKLAPRRRRSGLPREAAAEINRLRDLLARGEQARAERNEALVGRHAEAYRTWFDTGQGYPLSTRQREAILHDEENALVVAGAGTGKTSTIVGKVGYLLNAGLARPEEILLLAFTRKARDEMEDRLEKLSKAKVSVETFHSLGRKVLAHATGKKPSVSNLAGDRLALPRHVLESLKGLLDSDFGQMAREFITYHRYPYRAAHDFQSEHRYYQYLKGQEVRTLRGELVKSVEECLIADWLTCQRLEYVYEARYPRDTASVEHRQYKPDFYLPKYDIYIEHFALDVEGRPPPFFRDPEKYLEGIAWKRRLHQKYRTDLIETFSYQKRHGTLFPSLAAALEQRGVPLRGEGAPPPTNLLRSADVLGPIVSLFTSFLNLYKGNLWQLPELRAAATQATEPDRATKFLDAFEQVLSRYEEQLKESGEIDFNDMIRTATENVVERRFVSPFRYVLVDEFQDISRGRAKLLQAQLEQVPGRRLFCVGDDWQSIYRFAGSDLTLMTKFAEIFGFTRRTDLASTYRFNEKVLEASSKFVMQNPVQLRKQLVAATRSDLPAIVILSGADSRNTRTAPIADEPEEHVDEVLASLSPESPGGTGEMQRLKRRSEQGVDEEPTSGARGRAKALVDSGDKPNPLLKRALDEIVAESRDAEIDVLVLGRYRHCLPQSGVRLHEDRRLKIRCHTAHTAKGLEADYTVILDVTAGRWGFPTEIVDDPLLDLVLSSGESFPNAEERRLFYVALTRARARTYILTDDHQRSAFIDELEAEEYSGLVIPSGAVNRVSACPRCGGGRLRRIDGKYGVFWGCSNYPHCGERARPCPWCGAGAFVRDGENFRCDAPSCARLAAVCPSCGIGAIVPKTGRHGPFHGCTEWRREGPSCIYTRQRGGIAMQDEIDTSKWSRILIGGRQMPGACTATARTHLDARHDEIAVALLLTGQQLAEFEKLKPLLRPRGPVGEPQPIDVDHPALNVHGRLFVVLQIEDPKPTAMAGVVEVVLRMRRAMVEEKH